MRNISIIVPTINRSKQLSDLLHDLSNCDLAHVREVIIVDESKNDVATKVISNFTRKSPILVRYLKVDVQSLTRARNFAVERACGALILMFDDDIRVLDRNLFNNVFRVFSKNCRLKLLGILPKRKERMARFLYELARCFFMFNHPAKQFHVLFNGRNGGYVHLPNIKMCEAEWVAGCSFCFRREIFHDIRFEEQFQKYSFGEDFLFSHQVFKNYGREAVKCLLDSNVIHFEELTGRIPVEERICMEHCYRMYISHKLGIVPSFPVTKFLLKVIVLWGAVGDSLFSVLTRLVKSNKTAYAFVKTTFLHLRYCLLSFLYESKLRKNPNFILEQYSKN